MQRDLGALTAREHDLLVIGGGIYGAMAAWDAAQRGLSVALVEAADFGSGASWNSLKTIHGGLRDLQRADFLQARESVRERRVFLRIAPRLVRPLPFVVPTYGHGLRGREVLAFGLRLYDLVATDRNDELPPEAHLRKSRLLSRTEMLDMFPGLPVRGLSGGALWTDAQVSSSERLLMSVLHAACDHGALVANRAEVIGLRTEGGQARGAVISDHLDRSDVQVRARMILNAAGALDAIVRMAGIAAPAVAMVSGLNLVLKRPLTPAHALGALSGGRFLFAVPWRDRGLLGTAYGSAHPAEPRQQAEAFLREAARAYPWAGLTPADVAAVHHGLVPGGPAGLRSRPILLDHQTHHGVAGLVSIQGVKYTGARRVAEQAVDRVCARLGRKAAPCRTAVTVLAAASPLLGSLEEQARRAVREEMALHLDDAVLRRLDLGTGGRAAPADVATVARVMAEELGWTPERCSAEEDALTRALPYAAIPG